MFRDSRGVVHTVSSPDPLADLPPGAAAALQQHLLGGRDGAVDVGSLLTLAEQVRDLLGDWQDAFFDALPAEVDLDEEARWAQEAGLSLDVLEADDPDDGDPHDGDDLDGGRLVVEHDDLDGGPALSGPDGGLVRLLGGRPDADDPRAGLPEDLLTALERELLLLPVRVRLEALVAADDLVQEWVELVADEEKLLGHLALAHGQLSALRDEPAPQRHEGLVARHAALHAGTGPGHAAPVDP